MQKNKNKNIEIWGDGKARREFMYVSDLSNAILFSIKNFKKIPSILNIGTGRILLSKIIIKKLQK